jgi:solute carrier family 29 (equilibrative nucleoside transporter), member 1/2/3
VDEDAVTKALISRLTNSSKDDEELDQSSDGLTADLLEAHEPHQPETISKAKIMKIFNQIRPAAFSAWCSYLVTLGLFPSITVLIQSQHQCGDDASRFNNDLFIPFMFLMFNAFDFFGRIYAGMNQHGVTPENISYLVMTRIIFFPLFLFCNVSGSQLPVLFKADAWPIAFMALFAFSNGYLSTLAMMFGPTMVSARNAGLAGTIMIFSLTVGLMSGAATSFIALLISQGSI